MENVKKKESSKTVEKQKEHLLMYEKKSKDIEATEDGLVKKEIVEGRLKVSTTQSGEVCSEKAVNTSMMPEVKTDTRKPETVENLKTQLGVLMNSLATLSAEKSKMEANFQTDRKQLRSDREEYEKTIKDLKEKLKQVHKHAHSEVEHIKCKLIMERHEREKEQADHSAMIKELQRLVNDERRAKEQVESQVKELKNQIGSKGQNKLLETELEILKNKLKQAEATVKETPPLLISLQTEMVAMKRQHRNAIREEQKRAAIAEQQAKALAMTHEARVAGLEARLAELSETVGGYDRLRQQDQQAIQKLKDQLANLQEVEYKDHDTIELGRDREEVVAKIKKLYTHLLDLSNEGDSSSPVNALLSSLNLCDVNENLEYKEKYESLLQEFENYKKQILSKLNAATSNKSQTMYQKNSNISESKERDNQKAQLHFAKTHSKNLEERIRMLNVEMTVKEKEFKAKMEHQQQLLEEERMKRERTLSQKDNEYRGKIAALEQQLLRQRERILSLIEEKDQEIKTLKTSFRALLSKNESSSEGKQKASSESASESTTDLITGLLTTDSPPMLHYAQELARREVQISGLRKSNMKLEATLREKQRELLREAEKHEEKLKVLQAQITRLEACKSREGANLEYLKNVFVNYLTTNDLSSKRHMLNAISTVLRFTSDEIEKIRRVK